jgi:hypothetical protein
MDHDTCRQCRHLEARVAELEAENRGLLERHGALEAQCETLATLNAASIRLLGLAEREEVFPAIADIIANLVGSEEVGVLEITPDGEALSLVAAVGLDPATLPVIPLGAGLIGRSALSGAIYLNGTSATDGAASYEANLTACIPLKIGAAVQGAILVFRLLPQKTGLDRTDRLIFQFLAVHAAMALFRARRAGRANRHAVGQA